MQIYNNPEDKQLYNFYKYEDSQVCKYAQCPGRLFRCNFNNYGNLKSHMTVL